MKKPQARTPTPEAQEGARARPGGRARAPRRSTAQSSDRCGRRGLHRDSAGSPRERREALDLFPDVPAAGGLPNAPRGSVRPRRSEEFEGREAFLGRVLLVRLEAGVLRPSSSGALGQREDHARAVLAGRAEPDFVASAL